MAKAWIAVAHVDEVPPNEVRVIETDHEHIALCHASGSFYAVEDVCTHDGGPLGEGTLDGCAIECPRHGARFDVRTGAVLAPPAIVPVRTFPVRLAEDGTIEIEIDL
jgi:3-phenylpropionate/trans-cinnamate dioxygenase ferredoxin subunit